MHKKLISFRQKVLRRYKLLKGCAHCGYKKHFSALDFDHINKITKIKSISRLVTDSVSFKKIKDVGHLLVKVFKAQGLSSADIGGKSDRKPW